MSTFASSQEGQCLGLVGASLGDMGHSSLQHDPVCIPVALVNDYHFWAAVLMETKKVEYVDKGDPVLDVVLTAPRTKRQRAVPHDLESDSDGEDHSLFSMHLPHVDLVR